MPPSALSVQDVGVRFGGLTALEGISFEVAPHSVVGVIRLGSEPNGIVALNGYLWVTESGADEVAVVRPVG